MEDIITDIMHLCLLLLIQDINLKTGKARGKLPFTTIQITLEDRNVTANFTVNSYQLTILQDQGGTAEGTGLLIGILKSRFLQVQEMDINFLIGQGWNSRPQLIVHHTYSFK